MRAIQLPLCAAGAFAFSPARQQRLDLSGIGFSQGIDCLFGLSYPEPRSAFPLGACQESTLPLADARGSVPSPWGTEPRALASGQMEWLFADRRLVWGMIPKGGTYRAAGAFCLLAPDLQLPIPKGYQERSPWLVYCGCPATSVISFNSFDSIVYRHSSPRPGRRPLIRTNLDSDGDSCPSTSISNSPASNFSRLREATAFALNACVTLSFVFTCHLVEIWLYTGCARRCKGSSHLGESGLPALYRCNLIFAPDRPHQRLHVRHRSGGPFGDGRHHGRFIHGIGSVPLVQ